MSTFDAIGDPSLSEAIGKRLLTPGGAVAPGVAPEFFPCIVLENDRPEMHYLGNGSLWGRSSSAGVAAGGAGTRSMLFLVNSRASTLAVVESINVQSTVVLFLGLVRYGVNSGPPGTQLVGQPRDSRLIGRGSSCIVVTDNTLPVPTVQTFHNATSPITAPAPIVLAPGDALAIGPITDNIAITQFSLQWRERAINPSER